MNSNKAKITIGDRTAEMDIKKGTLGTDVINITPLGHDLGVFTLDPGFTSTASCESKITYIDGDKGILLYRGYPIDELAQKGDFLENCYLLLYGELPNKIQKETFEDNIRKHTMVNEQFSIFFRGFRRDAHPMAILIACFSAMSAFYHDSTDITDEKQRMIASIRLIAKVLSSE